MKKSFLNRVAAAAIAVPVALTQTALFTSFAEEDTVASNTVSVDTFLNITPDVKGVEKADASKYAAKEAAFENAYVQESTWNKYLKTAANSLADGTVYDVEATRIANSINPNSKYSSFLKDILGDASSKVSVEVTRNEAIVTIEGCMDVAGELENLEKAELSEYENVDLQFGDKGVFDVTVVVKANIADLANSKTVPVSASIITDKGETSVEEFITLFEEHYNIMKAYVEAAADAAVAEAQAKVAAASDADKAAAEAELADALDMREREVPRVLNKWLGRINTAKADYAKAKDVAAVSYTGANADEVLAQAREDAINKVDGRLDRVPETIDEALGASEYATALDLFTKAVAEANNQAANTGYTFDVTADDVIAVAKDAYDIEVNGEVSNYVATGDAFAYVTDDITDYTVYIDYFNDLLADSNQEVDEIFSVKAVEAEGTADKANLTGEGNLNIYRVIWFTTKDIEEETTEATEESTDPTEESTEADTTEEDTTAESTEADTTEEDTTAESTEPSTEEDTTEESTEPSTEEDTTEESTEPSTEEDTTAESTEPSTEEDTTAESTEADTTEPVSEEETTEPAELVLEVKTQTGFYFAHDPNSFDASELISSAAVVEGEGTVDMSKFSVESNPQAVYEAAGEAYVAADLQVYYDGQALEGVTAKAYIGVKGDADLNGVVNAEDAAKVLIYAAAKGAGKEAYLVDAVEADDTLEAFAYFLADTDGESTDNGATAGIDGATNASAVDSIDAANILVYAARLGSKGQADWINEVDEVTGVLSSPFPTYSESIAKTAGLLG